MVLIVTNSHDSSSSKVINWLKYFETPFFRLNSEVLLSSSVATLLQINNLKTSITINISEKELKFEDVDVIWFRRDSLPSNNDKQFTSIIKSNNYEAVKKFTDKEYNTIKAFMLSRFLEKQCIGNFRLSSLNKLEILNKAQKIGILFPDTIITNRKKELEHFVNLHSEVITKSAFESPNFLDQNNKNVNIYTEKMTIDSLVDIPDSFFPSLFQQNIVKAYEIRVFYLDEEFYSIAIFSQKDKQTQTDFRRYNYTKPNRMVPFELPLFLKDKIKLLMKDIGLNTGSLDFLMGIDGKFYFLEVNPVGQYGMVSKLCGFDLDKIIAKKLTDMYERAKRE